MTTSQGFTWTAELAEQLTWYGQHLMQPRLTGLTDAEYFWEPVPGCWNVRPRGGGPGLDADQLVAAPRSPCSGTSTGPARASRSAT